MTLDKVTIQAVNLEQPILEILLVLLDLVAQADGVFQAAQPVARVALLLVVGRREVVRQDDDGEEQRVADLRRARLEVRQRRDDVGARRALDVAGCDARAE